MGEHIMKKTAAILVATVLSTIVGCASTSKPVSMRGADVMAADHAPAAKTYADKIPGVGDPKLITRTFIGQPPLVPHTVEKYEPLTAEENACLDCHLTDELRGKKVPRVGESHFSKTAKTRDGKPAVEMTRFQCNNCHVPQVDAKELVDNKFVGATK
jgi:cytochrome c-type protein NapB